jgi:hypothetical protein
MAYAPMEYGYKERRRLNYWENFPILIEDLEEVLTFPVP